MTRLSDLEGKVIKSIFINKKKGNDYVWFIMANGEQYILYCNDSKSYIERYSTDHNSLSGGRVKYTEEEVYSGSRGIDAGYGQQTFLKVCTDYGEMSVVWYVSGNDIFLPYIKFEIVDENNKYLLTRQSRKCKVAPMLD